jgi:Tfp pilus assembly protein PilF
MFRERSRRIYVRQKTCQFACLLATVALGALSVGCASLPVGVTAPSQEQTRAAAAKPSIAIPDFDLLAASPEMVAFARKVVPAHGSEKERLKRLFHSLINTKHLQIEYDATANLSAAEAFDQRRANCLSFAAIFIALAREAGYKASFQEVDVPPTWLRTGDIIVRYLHVNTSVQLYGHRSYIAEFRSDRFEDHMPRRLISDEHALALHYNNVGATHLFKEELDHARAYFIHAIDTYPRLSIGWTNLGVVHRRAGDDDLAEISYRQALALDPRSYLAMTNLAAIYESRGQTELPGQLRELARHERLKNPHYHYALAQRAYDKSEFGEARKHLKAAIRRDKKEHRFHHLMALTLRELGDSERAHKSLQQAAKVAGKDEDKAYYREKLASWNDPS